MDDVVFSFKALFDNKYAMLSRVRNYVENIKEFTVEGNTITFKAKEKYFKNFDAAASGYWEVYPKHIYEDVEKAKKIVNTAVGSGPFVINKYERGKQIVLTRNPKWWGWKDPNYAEQLNFDRVIFRIFGGERIKGLELMKKGVGDFLELSPEEYVVKTKGDVWRKNTEKIKTNIKRPMPYGYIGWNLTNPKFKDKKVRRALAMLMNRQEMVKKYRYSLSEPATGPWFRKSPFANPEVKAIPFDPKAALALLREAGWKDSDKNGIVDKVVDGKKIELSFTIHFASKEHEKYLTWYQDDAKKAGVGIKLNLIEWNSLIKLLDERKFEAVRLGWGGGTIDNDPKQIWHSDSRRKGGSNYVGYNNPKVDELIDLARKEFDRDKRRPLLYEVYKLIAEDAPYVFLFNDTHIMYMHSKKIGKEKDGRTYGIGTSYWWDRTI